MPRWFDFFSRYSPVQSGSINTGSHNTRVDWVRQVESSNTTIDGQPLQDFITAAALDTDDNMKEFFREVLLKQLDPTIDKEEVIAYLMETFHQGGILFPVSAAINDHFYVMEAGVRKQVFTTASFDENVVRKINIRTTRVGFKVQELYTALECRTTPNTPPAMVEALVARDPAIDIADRVRILPDEDMGYVIQAETKIDLNFTTAKTPQLVVESNMISYGNAAVAAILDQRSYTQVAVDFVGRLFGFNSTTDWSDKQDEAAEASTSYGLA